MSLRGCADHPGARAAPYRRRGEHPGAGYRHYVAEAKEAIRNRVSLPPGYFTTWGGQFENQQRAMNKLKVIGPVAIGLILLLLFVTFRSMRLAMLVVFNLPFALIGACSRSISQDSICPYRLCRIHRAVWSRCAQWGGTGFPHRSAPAGRRTGRGGGCERKPGPAAPRSDDGVDRYLQPDTHALRRRPRFGSSTATRYGCRRRAPDVNDSDAHCPAALLPLVRAEGEDSF